ncbi:PulJ/GspJ family protein [Methylobacterium nodulans]|uniref:General secretion pathway protein J n=1 Tax=Methylobacterium nodulans (strain LMG 21967 / CNCM I-2342 / ORS 2060) TaxID=460265 RepID=B8IR73_METNO|nr:hypothetical protein [Methylobacterium nodulans]ACL56775.1 conserved hypothetical protein [Methylobacterium nodulans ORS 2060]
MRRERDAIAGFSLVEVLATLAVGAAILAALASFVSLLTRQADRVAVGAQMREVVGQNLGMLAQAVARAERLRWAGTPPRFVFAGTSETLLFALDRRDAAGIRTQVIEIRSVAGAEGGAFEWREGSFDPGLTDVAQVSFGAARSLPIGDATLRFAYVTPGTPRTPEILTDDWPASDALPDAVRLALIDRRSGEIRSTLRVPLLVGAEPGCLSPRKALCSRFDERKAPASDEEASSIAAIVGSLPYQVRR